MKNNIARFAGKLSGFSNMIQQAVVPSVKAAAPRSLLTPPLTPPRRQGGEMPPPSTGEVGGGFTTSVRRNSRLLPLVLLVFLLAACNPEAPTPTDEPNLPPRGTPTALPPAPAYREPTQPISEASAPELTLLGRLDGPGTTSSIFSSAFSPDGTRLAALNSDLLMVWNLTDGSLLFSASSQNATQVYYSPDKTEIYTLNVDGFVIVYNEDGVEVTSFSAGDSYNGVSAYYAPEGWLAVGSETGEVKVWDPMERTSLVTMEAHAQPVERLVFSADGERLATAGYEANIKLWDWRTRTLLNPFDLQGKTFSSMSFSPDGTRLAAGTNDAVIIFDTTTAESTATLSIPADGAAAILRYTPQGRFLVTAGHDTGLSVWNPATGEEVGKMPEVRGNRLSAVFSPDGSLMVTGVLDQAAALWNLAQITGEGIPRIGLDAGTRRIVSVGWSDDGYVVAFFDADGPVYIMGIPEDI